MRARAASLMIAGYMALASVQAVADQKDPRLDDLFAKLQSPSTTVAEARRLDAQIWRIWLQHPDARTYEATQIGISAMNGGRARLAELAFTEAIDRHPDLAEAWNKRATLRFIIGDLDGAIKDCAEVLKLEPRHFGALSGLGQIFMAKQEWALARRWFEETLKVHPHLPAVEQVIRELDKRIDGEDT